MSAVGDAEMRALVARAATGEVDALDQVVVRIRDDVYRLALRMLWHPKMRKTRRRRR